MTMKIAILGFGREGKSLLRFLQKRGLTRIDTQINADKNAEIWILDKKPNFNIRKSDFNIRKSDFLRFLKVQCGKNYLKNLSSFDIVYRSPGVPYNLPEIQKAIKKGVKFSSATQLFFEELRRTTRKNTQNYAEKIHVSPWPMIIGITGTKGKGTTATLLYKILKACGKKVFLAGNIGKSALDLVPRLSALSQRKSATTIVVLELSSFQLQDLKVSPEIAVVLETFPDHMDSHKNLREYFDAQTNIAKWQKKSDKIFYFDDNRWSKWVAKKSRAKKIPVSVRNFKLFKQEDLKMPGEHNLKNAAMAITVALSLGCPKNKIIKVVKNFRGNEHRLELVRIIKIPAKKHSNILENVRMLFYNDSASTNPQTAAAAIRAFKESKILISGGKDK